MEDQICYFGPPRLEGDSYLLVMDDLFVSCRKTRYLLGVDSIADVGGYFAIHEDHWDRYVDEYERENDAPPDVHKFAGIPVKRESCIRAVSLIIPLANGVKIDLATVEALYRQGKASAREIAEFELSESSWTFCPHCGVRLKG